MTSLLVSALKLQVAKFVKTIKLFEGAFINSWLSRNLTARGSCTSLVTIGPTKV